MKVTGYDVRSDRTLGALVLMKLDLSRGDIPFLVNDIPLRRENYRRGISRGFSWRRFAFFRLRLVLAGNRRFKLLVLWFLFMRVMDSVFLCDKRAVGS